MSQKSPFITNFSRRWLGCCFRRENWLDPAQPQTLRQQHLHHLTTSVFSFTINHASHLRPTASYSLEAPLASRADLPPSITSLGTRLRIPYRPILPRQRQRTPNFYVLAKSPAISPPPFLRLLYLCSLRRCRSLTYSKTLEQQYGRNPSQTRHRRRWCLRKDLFVDVRQHNVKCNIAGRTLIYLQCLLQGHIP